MGVDEVKAHIAGLDAAGLAPILLASVQRAGQIGRDAGVALAELTESGDADFDEGASWVEDVAAGAISA